MHRTGLPTASSCHTDDVDIPCGRRRRRRHGAATMSSHGDDVVGGTCDDDDVAVPYAGMSTGRRIGYRPWHGVSSARI